MSLKKKFSVLLLTFALSISLNAFADEFTYPQKNPAVSITFPDSWKVDSNENNLLYATPQDESVYFYFFPLPEEFDGLPINDLFQQTTDQVVIGFKPKDDLLESMVNGINIVFMDGKGKDKKTKKPVNVSVGLLLSQKSPKDAVVFLYFGSPASQAKHKTELSSIITSIKSPK